MTENPPSPDPDEEFPLLDINLKKLDFSQFHATGDHWPFTRYCRTQFGGGWHHLALAWEFRRRDELLAPWHRLRCRTGHHSPVQGWRRSSLDEPMRPYKACVYCDEPVA